MKVIKNAFNKLKAALYMSIGTAMTFGVSADVPTPEGVGTATATSGPIEYMLAVWNRISVWLPSILVFGLFVWSAWGLMEKFMAEKKKPAPEWGSVGVHALGTLAILGLGIYFASQATTAANIT